MGGGGEQILIIKPENFDHVKVQGVNGDVANFINSSLKLIFYIWLIGGRLRSPPPNSLCIATANYSYVCTLILSKYLILFAAIEYFPPLNCSDTDHLARAK